MASILIFLCLLVVGAPVILFPLEVLTFQEPHQVMKGIQCCGHSVVLCDAKESVLFLAIGT